MADLDDITGAIVDASLRIHKELGPGMFESVYEGVLARAMERRGFSVARQHPVSFEFDGMQFQGGFRVDLLIEHQIVVEIKSVERLTAVHGKQLLTYLRLMHLPVGLLINFSGATLKEGLKRVVNHLPPSASLRLGVNQRADRPHVRPLSTPPAPTAAPGSARPRHRNPCRRSDRTH